MANQILGEHDVPAPIIETLSMFARSDSIDMTNDHRFFRGNLLDKRLAAFGSLSVISGFMVDTAITQTYDMKKDVTLFEDPSPMDVVKFSAFLLFTLVLYANITAMYVAVAQTYHSLRLMTGGPTGFENAKLYYLHPSIVYYRHVAIRLMLNGLWIFLVGAALRLFTKFAEDSESAPAWESDGAASPASSMGSQPKVFGLTVLGLVAMVFYIIMGLSLFFIHRSHVMVFREQYERLLTFEQPLLDHLTTQARPAGANLDV